MLNEYDTVEYVINELNNQVGFFIENKNSAESLLENVSKLKMKYEIPYALYLTRQSKTVYNKQPSTISEDIAYELNLFFKEKIGQDYSIRFFDIKRMMFSLYKEDIEIVRFSLTNKNYGFMNSVIQSEGEYFKKKSSIEKSIENVKEEILANLIRLTLYEKIQGSNIELIKNIKSFKDVCDLLFSYKKIRKGIGNIIVRFKEKHEALTKNEETEKERLLYLNEQYERSKPIVEKVDGLFMELGYTQGERHLFYT